MLSQVSPSPSSFKVEMTTAQDHCLLQNPLRRDNNSNQALHPLLLPMTFRCPRLGRYGYGYRRVLVSRFRLRHHLPMPSHQSGLDQTVPWRQVHQRQCLPYSHLCLQCNNRLYGTYISELILPIWC